MKKTKLALDLAIGCVILGMVSGYRGLFRAQCAEEVAAALSDGAFLAAVLIGGLGGLQFARNSGTFDGMQFTVRQLFSLHWPGMFGEHRRDFAVWRDEKREKRQSAREALIAGGIYLLLAIGFTLWYMMG